MVLLNALHVIQGIIPIPVAGTIHVMNAHKRPTLVVLLHLYVPMFLYLFSGYASSVCSVCVDGTHLHNPTDTYCTVCAAGTYTNSDSGHLKQCAICPPGTSSPQGSSYCSICLPGYYSSSQQSSICSACPAGQYNNDYSFLVVKYVNLVLFLPLQRALYVRSVIGDNMLIVLN